MILTYDNSKTMKTSSPVFLAGFIFATIAIGISTNHAATLPGTSLTPSVWLDASQITGITDGQALATWTDASGNGRNATQANTLRRPFYHTGVANGLPAVRFNSELQPGGAANQFMAFSGSLANTGAGQLSLYVVAYDTGTRGTARSTVVNTRPNQSTQNGIIFGYGAPTVVDYAHISRSITEGGSGGIQNVPIGQTASFVLLTLNRDGFNSTVANYTDLGSDSTSVTWNGFVPSTMTATTQIATEGGSHYLFGDIAEIIAFDATLLSQADNDAVVKYLGDKYDIIFASTVPEPSSLALGFVGGLSLLFMVRRRFSQK